MTVAAGALISHGALAASDETSFVQIGGGIAMWCVVALHGFHFQSRTQMGSKMQVSCRGHGE